MSSIADEEAVSAHRIRRIACGISVLVAITLLIAGIAACVTIDLTRESKVLSYALIDSSGTSISHVSPFGTSEHVLKFGSVLRWKGKAHAVSDKRIIGFAKRARACFDIDEESGRLLRVYDGTGLEIAWSEGLDFGHPVADLDYAYEVLTDAKDVERWFVDLLRECGGEPRLTSNRSDAIGYQTVRWLAEAKRPETYETKLYGNPHFGETEKRMLKTETHDILHAGVAFRVSKNGSKKALGQVQFLRLVNR